MFVGQIASLITGMEFHGMHMHVCLWLANCTISSTLYSFQFISKQLHEERMDYEGGVNILIVLFYQEGHFGESCEGHLHSHKSTSYSRVHIRAQNS
jgi:hypothetical protein